jgi:peptide/nickel transport system substrate-binding protein
MRRRDFVVGLSGLGLAASRSRVAQAQASAQTRGESLRVLSEAGPNSFDPIGVGVNRYSIQATWNVYDRLVRFGTKSQADGTLSDDYFAIEGELAERFEIAPDRCRITFHLRRDAVFHDGTPVTAADVKWSLDRVVSVPLGRAQFATGSMTAPEQFTVVDDHTIAVTTPLPDRFTLPNFATTFPVIINATLARANANTADPWASEWLKGNLAGGGPFKLEAYTPGQSLVFQRHEAWRSGARPGFRRVVWQMVPNAQSRRAALERHDADLVQDLPPQDAVSLASVPDIRVVGVPMASVFQFIGMNNATAPFDNVKVRQAIAYALPYREMFDAALFKRGRPLFGGTPGRADGTLFPQPLGYDTDPARAQALLIETTFTFDASNAMVGEPLAILVQEALGKLGIRVTLNKVPPGQLGSLLANKAVPFFFEGSSALFADPDYFFRIFYSGATRWNFGSYTNAEFAALVDKTRFESDPAAYESDVARMIQLAKQEVPIILLWQPTLDTGMQATVAGYKYELHRMLDLRTLRRA